MNRDMIGVAIVGCGNIAGPYARDLATYPEIKIKGASDMDVSRAQALVVKHGGKVYPSLHDVLADKSVDIVVNLTIHHAHYDVTKQCLEAGKHVHSEKPLALTLDQARELVALAKAKRVRLGCSPFTYMGEAQQTAWNLIRNGAVGTIRLVYAEVNHGRIESWHPNPEPFYAVGPWFDVGVYPLTLLTTFFGPACRVRALGKVLYPDRVTKEGRPFHIETPDCMLAIVELADGPVVRLTVNFYVKDTRQRGLEFQGDAGAIHLGCFQGFNAAVAQAKLGEGFQDVPLIRAPYQGVEWGRGIRDMAEAIRDGRPHRATGQHAAHVVEILAGAVKSSETGRPVRIRSRFPMPTPMEWGM